MYTHTKPSCTIMYQYIHIYEHSMSNNQQWLVDTFKKSLARLSSTYEIPRILQSIASIVRDKNRNLKRYPETRLENPVRTT